MRIDIMTLFPGAIEAMMGQSIIGRAREREYLIPAVPEVFIASVDADAGVVRIHMMKGLATDEN